MLPSCSCRAPELRHADSSLVKVALPALIVLGALHECQATANLNASHENLLFVAAASGSTVHREQSNLAYELQFSTSNNGINIVGVSLIPNILGSATFNAFASSPTTVRVELVAGTAAAADYTGALSGMLNLSWSHDGVPGNANLNVQMRALDVANLVAFEGYTSTSAASSDITPITLNGSPPFGAARYVWSGFAPSTPVGLTFSLVGHDGILGPQTRRWVVVGGGPAWTNQNTTFAIEFSNNLGNMAHRPRMTFDLRLRSCSGVTIYQGQSLYTLEGPISAPAASPSGYTLSTSVADGSTVNLHPTLGSVDTYAPAAGWDSDTTMDISVRDGAFCTTLTVRNVDLRFRALMADGYTIFRGHQRGQGVIGTGLPNDTYSFSVEAGASAFPAITAASGVTPLLSFGLDGSIDGLPTPPPASQWAVDDTFNLLVRDGTRPRSRVIRAASFRELPSELTHFVQQIAADPATAPSSTGAYVIQAVDADWLSAPPGEPPIILGSGDPRPGFSAIGALIDYPDGGTRPAVHYNRLLIMDGNRPWSAGADVTFELRYLADSTVTRIDSDHPLLIPRNGPFIVHVVDGDKDWAWSSPALDGFAAGNVAVDEVAGPNGNFEATDVIGSGRLQFVLSPASTSPDHPAVLISLEARAVVDADFDNDGDVDQADLELFEQCASGPCVPHNASETCWRADFEDDNDVDQVDFGVFQQCFSGANIAADFACMS